MLRELLVPVTHARPAIRGAAAPRASRPGGAPASPRASRPASPSPRRRRLGRAGAARRRATGGFRCRRPARHVADRAARPSRMSGSPSPAGVEAPRVEPDRAGAVDAELRLDLLRSRPSSGRSRSSALPQLRYVPPAVVELEDRPAAGLARGHAERPLEGGVRGADPQRAVEHHQRVAHRLARSPRRSARARPISSSWRFAASMSTSATTAPSIRLSMPLYGRMRSEYHAALAVAHLALDRRHACR